MRTNKIVLWAVFCFMVVMLTACRTPETIVQKPEPIDLTPSMTILFDTRPDNNDLEIIEDVKTLDDVIHNSAQYLMAWELWETYSDSLEVYIRKIGELVAAP